MRTIAFTLLMTHMITAHWSIFNDGISCTRWFFGQPTAKTLLYICLCAHAQCMHIRTKSTWKPNEITVHSLFFQKQQQKKNIPHENSFIKMPVQCHRNRSNPLKLWQFISRGLFCFLFWTNGMSLFVQDQWAWASNKSTVLFNKKKAMKIRAKYMNVNRVNRYSLMNDYYRPKYWEQKRRNDSARRRYRFGSKHSASFSRIHTE